MKSAFHTLLTGTAALVFAAGTSQAAIVFTDDFESPDVSAAQSTGNTSGAITTTKWVRATDGFGSNRQGTVDETALAFTDPVGEQAYAFRYTNSGITSAFEQVGSLALGDMITVSFDVVMDGVATGIPYEAGLVTFDGAGTRTSVNSTNIENNTTSVLATTSGNATTDGDYTNIILSYTVGNSVFDNNGGTAGVATAWNSALLGHDIAIRFAGQTNSAIIDNVVVDIIPEPGSALLGSLGLLALLRRRR